MSEENNGGHIRQITIASLNESVNLLSSYPEESMDYLTDKALELLNKIKNGDEKV